MGAVEVVSGLYELPGGLMLERTGHGEGDVYRLPDSWAVAVDSPHRQRALTRALIGDGLAGADAEAVAAAVWAAVDAVDEEAAEAWADGRGVY